MGNTFAGLLRHCISEIAAEADEQIRSVPSVVSFAEDALETVGDLLDAAISGAQRGVLSDGERQVLSDFRTTLDRIVGDVVLKEGRRSEFWSDKGLRSHVKWRELRRAARDVPAKLPSLGQ
jgi:hypothetical protein